MAVIRPAREQFEIRDNEVIHTPTNARWTAYTGRPTLKSYNAGLLGAVLSNGDQYREDEVREMAQGLLRYRKAERGDQT
jgi:hypothetical protein